MNRLDNRGFTLIELMVAMVIGGVVLAGVVQTLFTQVKLQNAQFAVSRTQQSMRAAMDYMVRYVRMAGYDPSLNIGAGFQGTLANRLDFTLDIGTLDDGLTTNDNVPNGVIDDHWDEKVVFKLVGDRVEREKTDGTGELVAENIEALNFRYLDADGNDTTTNSAVRSVQITMVGRTPAMSGVMPSHTDTTVYRNQRGDILLPAQHDSVRRLLLTAEVKCRNLNL